MKKLLRNNLHKPGKIQKNIFEFILYRQCIKPLTKSINKPNYPIKKDLLICNVK